MTDEKPLAAIDTNYRHDSATPFDVALRRNFPSFLTPVELSTPVNATPFIVGKTKFDSVASRWPGRARLIESLDHAITGARQHGIEVFAYLLGGSFTDLRNEAPKDIDAILFYRRATEGEAIDVPGLADFQKRAKGAGADVRFVPADGDPLVLIKSVSYFTKLYSESRAETPHARSVSRGLILVDCATTCSGSVIP